MPDTTQPPACRAQERQWRKEERREFDEAVRLANQQPENCLCRAVRDWSPGPACYQQEAAAPTRRAGGDAIPTARIDRGASEALGEMVWTDTPKPPAGGDAN